MERFQARKQRLEALANWQLQGRAAIATANDSGTLSVDWLQRAGRYKLQLVAPFGAGEVTVQGRPGWVTLHTSDGKTASAASASDLLYRATGFDLPLEMLRSWVVGVPAPGATDALDVDGKGLLRRLVQSGWTVRYLRYRDVRGLALPERIAIDGEGLKLRIAVEEWGWGS